MRITKKDVEHQVHRLNAYLNRPETSYTSNVANEGHFFLQNVGSGSPNYNIDETSGSGRETNTIFTGPLKEVHAFIRGMLYHHRISNFNS